MESPWNEMLPRYYSSLSTKPGLWGAGWCHLFDDTVEHEGDAFTWNFCGEGAAIRLEPGSVGVFTNGWATLRTVAKTAKHRLELPGGQVRIFDAHGHLESVLQPGSGELVLKRDSKGQPTSFQVGKEVYAISVQGGRVVRIQKSNKALVTYVYKSNRLTEIHDGEAVLYRYQTSGRLESIRADGFETKKMTYDKKGRVVAINHHGCTEEMRYEESGLTFSVHQKASCNGQIVEERSYKSTFDSSRKKLVSQEQKVPGSESLVQLKPENGLPLRKVVNQTETTFTYDDAGRLKTSKSFGKIENYAYDTSNRLVKYERFVNQKKEETFEYEYIEPGQLKSVKRNGQRVAFKIPAAPSGRKPASTTDRMLELKSYTATDSDRMSVLNLLASLDVLRRVQSFHEGIF